MKKRTVKKVLAVAMAATMATGVFAGCGQSSDGAASTESGKTAKSGEDNHFSMWIYQTDGAGTYYTDYNDASAVQYIEAQTWDTKNGGIGEGNSLDFDFQVPVAGSEVDNFNTLIATGDYPDLLDLSVSTENAAALADDGILMEITDYVEQYMPHYVAYLDEHPELKLLCTTTDDEGKIHYYQICQLTDSARDPWQGYMYRRDWLVKYAEPTEYVWDWDSDVVKNEGHPEVTPLSEAESQNNLNGWKKNEVTAFSAEPGDDPDNTYTDNVIFPSGTQDPLTISDWEWMFEAFDKAIAERGWTDAYDISIGYAGNTYLGDLVSSFGGGNGSYYINKDKEVVYDGTSENFKTYTDCMKNWYDKGWLDKQFYTRTDVFYMINSAGVSQGKVGLWTAYYGSSLGTVIRGTCMDESDMQDAYVMAAPLPVNDTYGTDDQKYKEPDCLYHDSRVAARLGVTTKCEKKDLATLFTFFDWTYTEEGAATVFFGLNEEQVNETNLDPNLYEEYGYKASYEKTTDEEGNTVYNQQLIGHDDPVGGAMTASRLCVGMQMTGNGGEYTIEKDIPAVQTQAFKLWTKYEDTGSATDYTSLLDPEASQQWNTAWTKVNDAVSQNLPKVITGDESWEDYVSAVTAVEPDSVCGLLQEQLDKAK